MTATFLVRPDNEILSMTFFLILIFTFIITIHIKYNASITKIKFCQYIWSPFVCIDINFV